MREGEEILSDVWEPRKDQFIKRHGQDQDTSGGSYKRREVSL